MKVISILQPWATLIVLGHKKIETRSWNTKYRGPLLIHASAGIGKVQREMFQNKLVKECLKQYWTLNDRLSNTWNIPRGAIIGRVDLIDTARTSDILLMKDACVPIKVGGKNIPDDWGQEIAFGDYSPNRFGWLLDNHKQFTNPIPAKGKLGIWEYWGDLA